MKDCSYHHSKYNCKYCLPCTCDCHKHRAMGYKVYHCMPCCRKCTECGRTHRKQFYSKEVEELKNKSKD